MTDLPAADEAATPTAVPSPVPAEEAVDAPVPEADPERLIVLGEDFLLADVLALGGAPVAATATLNDRFSGIERDTSGITPLPATEANLELLASLEPDRIILTSFAVQQIDLAAFEAIAPTAVIGGEDDWRVRVRDVGAALGAEADAEALLQRYDEAVAIARTVLPDDFTVTIATVYSGPTLAVWTDGPTNIPQTFLDLGATLVPGAGSYPDERIGRSYLSNELIPDLAAPVLVLSQTAAVEGEDLALAEIEQQTLWQSLPAVTSGTVFTVDRLGYPGVEGRIRLIDDIVAAVGG